MEISVLDEIRKEIRRFSVKYIKSSDQASVHRKNGNNNFVKGKYDLALKSYNQAIVTAPLSSDELCYAFANRSAALFHLNRYSECLIDIDCAFQHGYQIDKADKLLKRKASCLDKLSLKQESSITNNRSTEVGNVIGDAKKINAKSCENNNEHNKENCNDDYELDLPKFGNDLKVDYLSSSVEITEVKSKGGGFGIRSIAPINCGSNILEEKATISILSPDFYNLYCYHCFKLVNSIPFPCQGCSQIIFCSSKCSKICWTQYHSRECNYLDYFIFTEAFHYVPKIALRTLLLCGPLNCIKYHQDQQQQTKQSTPSSNSSTEGNNKSKKKNKKKSAKASTKVDESATFNAELYRSICSLVEHPEDSNDYTYFTFKIIAYLIEILKEPIPMNLISNLSSLIAKHFRATIINAIALQDRSIDENNTDWTIETKIPQIKEFEIGCGIFLTFRYLNHSCIPNVHLAWFNGNNLRMIATRDIKPGEEILNSYGVHYKYQLASRRKELLRTSYYFDCACEACVTGLQPLNKAFVCPECSGPVICDGQIICLDCGSKDHLDVTKIMSEAEAYFKLIAYDDKTRSSSPAENLPRLKITEKLLLDTIQALSVYLFKTHTEMGKLYQKLVNCYLKIGNERKAYEYSKKYLEVVKASSSGSIDINVLNGLLVVLVCCYRYHSKDQDGAKSSPIEADWKKLLSQVEKLICYLLPIDSAIHKSLMKFVETLKQ